MFLNIISSTIKYLELIYKRIFVIVFLPFSGKKKSCTSVVVNTHACSAVFLTEMHSLQKNVSLKDQ